MSLLVLCLGSYLVCCGMFFVAATTIATTVFILAEHFSISFKCYRDEDSQRAAWKLDDISEVSENGSQGCIRAKFDLKSGPSIPATTAIQFVCEGALLSGVDFELIGNGYRISLAKKRFGAGICYLFIKQNFT